MGVLRIEYQKRIHSFLGDHHVFLTDTQKTGVSEYSIENEKELFQSW